MAGLRGHPSCPTCDDVGRRPRATAPHAPAARPWHRGDLRDFQMPQWPCEVYSHKHTSVTTTGREHCALMARTPPEPFAIVVVGGRSDSSLCAGVPNSRTPGTLPRAPLRFLDRFVHRQLKHARHRRTSRRTFCTLATTEDTETLADNAFRARMPNAGRAPQAARPASPGSGRVSCTGFMKTSYTSELRELVKSLFHGGGGFLADHEVLRDGSTSAGIVLFLRHDRRLDAVFSAASAVLVLSTRRPFPQQVGGLVGPNT